MCFRSLRYSGCMNDPKPYRVATIVGIIILVLLIAFLWARRGGEGGMATSTPITVSTSTLDTIASGASNSGGITATGQYTVSKDTIALEIPDFKAPIIFSASVSPEVRTILNQKLAIVQASLAKDQLDLKAWLDLGTLRKMGGDWKAAETAWKFVTTAAPGNTGAFWDLGDLYMNFLNQYPAAETAYKKVIALDPTNVSAYDALFQMYRNLYKQDTSSAVDILKQGIAKNPSATDLMIELARYYKSEGSITSAKQYYDQAIAAAQKAGNTQLVADLKVEAGE